MGAKDFRAFAKNIPIVGDIIKSYEEEDDREYQRNLNQLQMDREDTNYQRTVSDMNMAGLSPLSMGSTDTSTAGTTTTHDVDSATDRLNNTLTTISNIAKTTQEVKNIKATTEGVNLENKLLKDDKKYLDKEYGGSRYKYEVDTDPTKKLMNAITNVINKLSKGKDSILDISEEDGWEKVLGTKDERNPTSSGTRNDVPSDYSTDKYMLDDVGNWIERVTYWKDKVTEINNKIGYAYQSGNKKELEKLKKEKDKAEKELKKWEIKNKKF